MLITARDIPRVTYHRSYDVRGRSHPKAFRRSPNHSICPTPSGRWKVRKLNFPIRGCFLAYRDHLPSGHSRGMSQVFTTFEEAIRYAELTSYFFHETKSLSKARRQWLTLWYKREIANYRGSSFDMKKQEIDRVLAQERNDYAGEFYQG